MPSSFGYQPMTYQGSGINTIVSPQQLQASVGALARLERQVSGKGTTPGFIGRITETLSQPQFAVRNTIEGIAAFLTGEGDPGEEFGEALKNLGQFGTDILFPIRPLFGVGYHSLEWQKKNRDTMPEPTDVLRKLHIADIRNPWAELAVNIGVGFFDDPLNWLTFGGVGAVKGAARGISKTLLNIGMDVKSAERIADDVLRKGIGIISDSADAAAITASVSNKAMVKTLQNGLTKHGREVLNNLPESVRVNAWSELINDGLEGFAAKIGGTFSDGMLTVGGKSVFGTGGIRAGFFPGLFTEGKTIVQQNKPLFQPLGFGPVFSLSKGTFNKFRQWGILPDQAIEFSGKVVAGGENIAKWAKKTFSPMTLMTPVGASVARTSRNVYNFTLSQWYDGRIGPLVKDMEPQVRTMLSRHIGQLELIPRTSDDMLRALRDIGQELPAEEAELIRRELVGKWRSDALSDIAASAPNAEVAEKYKKQWFRFMEGSPGEGLPGWITGVDAEGNVIMQGLSDELLNQRLATGYSPAVIERMKRYSGYMPVQGADEAVELLEQVQRVHAANAGDLVYNQLSSVKKEARLEFMRRYVAARKATDESYGIVRKRVSAVGKDQAERVERGFIDEVEMAAQEFQLQEMVDKARVTGKGMPSFQELMQHPELLRKVRDQEAKIQGAASDMDNVFAQMRAVTDENPSGLLFPEVQGIMREKLKKMLMRNGVSPEQWAAAGVDDVVETDLTKLLQNLLVKHSKDVASRTARNELIVQTIGRTVLGDRNAQIRAMNEAVVTGEFEAEISAIGKAARQAWQKTILPKKELGRIVSVKGGGVKVGSRKFATAEEATDWLKQAQAWDTAQELMGQLDPGFADFVRAGIGSVTQSKFYRWLQKPRDILGGETVLSIYKRGYTTGVVVPFPAFAVRNMMSGVFQLSTSESMGAKTIGGTLQIAARPFKEALNKVMSKALGWTGFEASQLNRILDGGAIDGQMMSGIKDVSEATFAKWLTDFGVVRGFVKTENLLGLPNTPVSRTGRLANKILFNKAANVGTRIGDYSESIMRVSGFKAALAHGLSPSAAAEAVNNAFLDYFPRSQFEKVLTDVVWPFGKFKIRTTEQLMKAIPERPWLVGTLDAFYMKREQPEFPLPEFLLNEPTLPLDPKNGVGRVLAGLGGPDIPLVVNGMVPTLGVSSLKDFLTSTRDWWEKGVVADSHPILKFGYMVVSGRDPYSGREAFKYDRAPEWVRPFVWAAPELMQTFGVEEDVLPDGSTRRKISPHWLSLLQATPFSRVSSTLDKLMDERSDVMDKVLRSTTGIRIHHWQVSSQIRNDMVQVLEKIWEDERVKGNLPFRKIGPLFSMTKRDGATIYPTPDLNQDGISSDVAEILKLVGAQRKWREIANFIDQNGIEPPADFIK